MTRSLSRFFLLETAREGQYQQDQQDQTGKSPADAWSTGVEASASQHDQENDQDHKHAHGVNLSKNGLLAR